MKYTAEQLKVISTINRIARKRGVPRRHHYAALTTGAVESNFRNLTYGDADSQGWRQERASLYKNPTNLRASINRFFDEAAQHDRGQSPGELAADVQRPAAQYRGRYADHLSEARKLAGRGGSTQLPTPGRVVGGRPPQMIPGGEVTDQKAAMLAALQDDRKGMSLFERYRQAAGSGQFTQVTPTTVVPGVEPRYESGGGGRLNSGGGGRLQRLKKRADVIDKQRQPYLWGGGHQGKTKLRDAVPLDCSGAVSKLLGINPRVASQFKTWGRPGRGKNFTVWANDEHVLVEIAGQFWGTSKSNPGGGAGWIPASAISKSYLSRFTPRHF